MRRSFEPDSPEIVISIGNGVVTLVGVVRSFNEMWRAEDAVRNIAGVVAIVAELEVRVPVTDQRTDSEIARAAVAGIQYEVPDVADEVLVAVADGVVTLGGEVRWYYKRLKVERIVSRLLGVMRVKNNIVVKPVVLPLDIKTLVSSELHRNPLTRDAPIQVVVRGTQVTLTGAVDSWACRDAAEDAAGHAANVAFVHNQLTVQTHEQPIHGGKGDQQGLRI